MYCTKCAAQNDDNAWKCIKCGEPLMHPAVMTSGEPIKIHNYIVPAILITICCCVPLGIPAIVYAAQVNCKVAGGDIDGAIASSRKAKMWCWIAFGVGLVVIISWLILQVLAATTTRKP